MIGFEVCFFFVMLFFLSLSFGGFGSGGTTVFLRSINGQNTTLSAIFGYLSRNSRDMGIML
jgi:hypothetical protein